MDAIFWKHYNLYTLLSCDHHLLFIDVKVLVHELQGLCAADEGQRVQAEDGPVLIHSSHVLGIFSLDPQGCHAADTQEEGELTTGSGHDQESPHELAGFRPASSPPLFEGRVASSSEGRFHGWCFRACFGLVTPLQPVVDCGRASNFKVEDVRK